ncbi:MAG TPA: phosphoribosylformylglycinamidine cyclo-ligase [Actinomycetota bacterium]
MTEPPRAATYAAAGVDIEAGDKAVEMIKDVVASTARPEVLGILGGFSGAFAPDFSRYRTPVLLSSTDGVGSKLAIAQTLGRHDTVGIDLVAMVVDDLVCDGGEPLFLLDYIACGRLVPERIAAIVEGIADGCRQAGCALIGGETAEHPGLMDPDHYDLAAFAVGVADRDDMPGPHRVGAGDVLVGLRSSGPHSNGYSLIRRLILEHDLELATDPDGLGVTLGEALLTPTTIYAPEILLAMRTGGVHAAAHVTGGGLGGNLARVLPDGAKAVVHRDAWQTPHLFSWLAGLGRIADDEMRRTFNMGIGMVLVVAQASVHAVLDATAMHRPVVIGEIVPGPRVVELI